MVDTTFCAEEGMLQGQHTISHPRFPLDDKYTENNQTGYKMLENASLKSWRGHDMYVTQ